MRRASSSVTSGVVRVVQSRMPSSAQTRWTSALVMYSGRCIGCPLFDAFQQDGGDLAGGFLLILGKAGAVRDHQGVETGALRFLGHNRRAYGELFRPHFYGGGGIGAQIVVPI